VLTTFIGKLDRRPVGFACLRLIPHLQGDEPYAELTGMCVDAPFRRHGAARAQIAHVEAVARTAGAGGVVIITGFDNAGAQAAYCATATPIGRWRCRSASRANNEKRRNGVTFYVVSSSYSTGRVRRRHNPDGWRATQ
jgi:GNAT superfamily N-acetyltransferase